ncbi:putative flagellar motor rotation protein [Faustovirus]|nr:putative flagellar motor rotation protein [Faustovirus]
MSSNSTASSGGGAGMGIGSAIMLIIVLVVVFVIYKIYKALTNVGTPMQCPPGVTESSPGLCDMGCPAGYEESTPGICSVVCPSGFKSSATACERPTTTVDPNSNRVCPSDYPEKVGANCYKYCPNGSSRIAQQCYKNCDSGYRTDGVLCTPETTTRSVKQDNAGKGTGMVCPSGYNYQNGLCYPNCPSGTDITSQGICTQPCPWGYYWTGSSCQANGDLMPYTMTDCDKYGVGKDCPSGYYKSAACSCQLNKPTIPIWELTRYDYTGKAVTPNSCPSDKPVTGGDGRCYPSCPSGSSMDWGQYTCRSNCPSGYKQYANTCTKDGSTYSREKTRDDSNPTSYKNLVCPQEAPNDVNGLCYPNCPNGQSMLPAMQGKCAPPCPANTTDYGTNLCTRATERKIKPASEIGVCPDGKVDKAGLCYDAPSGGWLSFEPMTGEPIEVGAAEHYDLRRDAAIDSPIDIRYDNPALAAIIGKYYM